MCLKSSRMNYDDYSCIKEITKKVPITLSTAYQGNEIAGISNILDNWKRQYIQQLQGVVVSYRNVSLMSKYAYIKSDYPIILCNVKATFELFIPTIGSIVKGKVNRISHDYIGCLVHNCINVAIDRASNDYDNISNSIFLDQIILFEITHIGFKRKIIRVKGKITQKCTTLMESMHPSPEEVDSVNHNYTILSQELKNADSDENRNNDRDLYNKNQSESSLSATIDFVDESLNDISSSTSKKKKSKKYKSDKCHDRQTEILTTENRMRSPSLLSNNSVFTQDLNNVSHNSPKKKKRKLDVAQVEHTNFDSFEPTVETSSSISPNALLSESVGSLDENLLSKNSVFSQDLNNVSHNSPKKKKRKLDIAQVEHTNFESFVPTVKKSGSISPNTLLSEGVGSLDENSIDNKSHHSKKKKKKSKEKLSTEQGSLLDITPTFSCLSPQKGKSKQDDVNSSGLFPSAIIKEELLTDTSSQLSSSQKKKKHKSSKSNRLSSPPIFDDSLSSKDETDSSKQLKSPSKKKKKVSQETFAVPEQKPDLNYLNSSLNETKDSDSLRMYALLQKTDIKTENIDSLIEALSSYDPSFENDTNIKSPKKAKKRKLESPERDGLPKKRKKVEEGEDTLVKSSDKHKKKKQKKEKSEKDSKKNKKAAKKRVISSKKKLPKLKKEKRDKKGKLKKKNLKKSSKHKEEDVP